MEIRLPDEQAGEVNDNPLQFKNFLSRPKIIGIILLKLICIRTTICSLCGHLNNLNKKICSYTICL